VCFRAALRYGGSHAARHVIPSDSDDKVAMFIEGLLQIILSVAEVKCAETMFATLIIVLSALISMGRFLLDVDGAK
jgi:hypothetical protein